MSARCTKIAYLAKNQYPFVVCAYLVYARRLRIFPKKSTATYIFGNSTNSKYLSMFTQIKQKRGS